MCWASRRISAPTYWIALINGGYPPKVVATDILQTKASRESQAVEGAYEQLLGRAATTAELKRALAAGNTSTTPLYARIFGSKEFYQTRGGGTNDGFLTALAKDWFGTPFKPATQARLARELSTGASRHRGRLQRDHQPERRRMPRSTRIFEDVLDRPATAREREAHSRRWSARGNMVSVYATLFASQEFKAKFVNIT